MVFALRAWTDEQAGRPKRTVLAIPSGSDGNDIAIQRTPRGQQLLIGLSRVHKYYSKCIPRVDVIIVSMEVKGCLNETLDQAHLNLVVLTR